MSEPYTPSGRLKQANRGFSFVVFFSIVLHSLAIGGALYAQHSTPRIDIARVSIPVELVQLGKRRDPKLLPRLVEEQKAEAPPDEGVPLETKNTPPEEKSSKKKKEKQPKLSDAAKKLLEGKTDALDRVVKKMEEREGDPEGDVNGTTTDPTKAAQGYMKAIISTLKGNYRLPETIPASQRQFLRASVVLFIDRDGSILRYEFTQRHPNELFMAALDSLLKSIKLPPPPAAQAQSLHDTGIEVIFKP
jgi:outer membrane biosynthesis protein TonB